MTMQCAVPGLSKLLATLLMFTVIAAASLAASLGFPSIFRWAEPAQVLSQGQIALETAESGPNSKFITGTTLPLKLPDRWVYGNVVSPVPGMVPSTHNGKTGQIAMFVLLFTFLSAVALLMWRHSRRDDASPRRIGRRI